MKWIISLLAGFACFFSANAQLKTTAVCPPFSVDVLEGTVNDLFAYATIGEVEKKFPCFVSTTPETNGSTCGGVFFNDKDIYFYTERDYIEVGEHFKGKLSLPLIGASRTGLFKWLGYPTIKDVNWDAYQTKYGILILYFNKAGKINKLQISNRNSETMRLCE
jgi:hypothetical protein